MANDGKGHAEASFIGFGFGAVLGGLVAGSAADVMNVNFNSLIAYAVGGVVGAFLGLVAGRFAGANL
jgi:hypothetical protein